MSCSFFTATDTSHSDSGEGMTDRRPWDEREDETKVSDLGILAWS